MIYLFRDADPLIFDTHSVLSGPPADPEVLRYEFAIAQGGERKLINPAKFKAWLLKEKGFKDLGDFVEIDMAISDGELTAWSARLVGGPNGET